MLVQIDNKNDALLTAALNFIAESCTTDSLTPQLQTNQQVFISLQEDATTLCLARHDKNLRSILLSVLDKEA